MPDPVSPAVAWLLGIDDELDDLEIADAFWLAALRSATAAPEAPGQLPEAGGPDPAAPAPPTPGEAPKPSSAPAPAGRPGPDAVDAAHDMVAGRADPAGDRTGHPARATPGHGPISRTLAQSMRALKTRWPHGRGGQLDLDRTVEQYAATGLLLPILRPAPERWFDVDVVVDRSGSGPAWDEAVDGFVTLLQELGAFRTIRRWQLSFAGSAPQLHDPSGRRSPRRRLRSSDHRRLVFVMSDFTDDAWYSPPPWLMLREWAGSTATVLVGLLPPKLRHLTKVDVPTARAGPGLPGTPNVGLDVPRIDADGPALVPLPLLALNPPSLRRWSGMLMRGDPTGCQTILLPAAGPPLHQEAPDGTVLSGGRVVERFDLLATAEARRIARLAAAFSHVSVPVLRFVAQRMVPDSTAADLAEVLVSGLFTTGSGPRGRLEFRPDTREILLRRLMAPDVWEILETLEQYVAENAAGPARFAGPLSPSPDVQPFVEASSHVQALLGLTGPAPDTSDPTGGDTGEHSDPGLTTRRRALLIRTRDSTGPGGDIAALRETLHRFGFTTTVCDGPDATRAGILGAYERFIGDTHDGDAAFVYYTGDAELLAVTPDDPTDAESPAGTTIMPFIAPLDFTADAEDFRGIMTVELTVLVALLTARTSNVTVAFDCGYAAGLIDGSYHYEGFAHPRRLYQSLPGLRGAMTRNQLLPGGDALRRKDVPGNPLVVRLAACAATQGADPDGSGSGATIGVFTDALVRALSEADGLRVSWETILDRVRRQVLAVSPVQRPEISGPARRALFEVEELPREVGLAVSPAGPGRLRFVGAPLFGIEIGDEYAIFSGAAGTPIEGAKVGDARIDRLSGASAEGTFQPHGSWTAVPEGARAHRTKAVVPPMPVRIIGSGRHIGAFVAALSGSDLVRVARPDEPCQHEVRLVDGNRLSVRDRVGELFDPVATDADGVLRVIWHLERLARATALRNLHEEPLWSLDVPIVMEWGRIIDEAPHPLPATGATVHEGDHLYVRVRNAGEQTVFLSLVDIGVAADITLLTAHSPDGVRLRPTEVYVFGADESNETTPGTRVEWSPAVTRAAGRPETIVVLAMSEPRDMRPVQQRVAPQSSRHVSPMDQVLNTGIRDIGNAATRGVRYAVHTITFTLLPTPPAPGTGGGSEPEPVPSPATSAMIATVCARHPGWDAQRVHAEIRTTRHDISLRMVQQVLEQLRARSEDQPH